MDFSRSVIMPRRQVPPCQGPGVWPAATPHSSAPQTQEASPREKPLVPIDFSRELEPENHPKLTARIPVQVWRVA
jgi:hypothetical protein